LGDLLDLMLIYLIFSTTNDLDQEGGLERSHHTGKQRVTRTSRIFSKTL
jgi:hypothetical protein